MTEAASQAPDALVLGGGGILGEAWMNAVLAGLADAAALDARRCGCYVGTSAGSIVAASLVAGLDPRSRLGSQPEQPPPAPVDAGERPGALRQAIGAAAALGDVAAGPLASLLFSSSAAGGAIVRRAALNRIPAGRRSLDGLGRAIERTGVLWDGRLRIVALELETGRRVVFGSPGAPELSVAAAVQASCAIPGVFAPIVSTGRTYVDGGAWSPTNMDVADVGRGGHVLCLNPTGSFRPRIGQPAGAIGAASLAIATAEALVLKRRGATVRTVNPDEASARAMGINLMNARRREAVIEAGLTQGRTLANRVQRQPA